MSKDVINTPLIDEIIENINVKKALCLSHINSFETDRYYKDFNRFVSRCNSSDKEKIINTSNHDFLIYIFLRRNKSEVMGLDEANDLFKPFFKTIDSWNYRDVTFKLNRLINHYSAIKGGGKSASRTKDILTVSEIGDILESLGLSRDLLEYELCDIFYAMDMFLEFKKNVEDIKLGNYLDGNSNGNLLSSFLPKGFAPNTMDIIKQMPIKRNKNELMNIAYSNTLKPIIDFYDEQINSYYETDKYIYDIDKKSLEILRKYDSASKLSSIFSIDDDFYEYVEDIFASLDSLLTRQIIFNIAEKYRIRSQYAEELDNKIGKSSLTTYLYHNGINPYSIPNLSHYEEKEDIIPILDFLSSMGIDQGTALMSYSKVINLLNSDLINKIGSILQSGASSFKFLIDNYEYVLSNIDSLNDKISLLSSHIRFDDKKVYDENILLESLKNIRERLLIIGHYECLKKSRKLQTYLLCNIEYINILDLMIENDIELNLLMQICKCASPIDTIKKIIICKQLDIDYMKGVSLSSDVAIPGRFYGNDSKLDILLGNYTSVYGNSNCTSYNGSNIDFKIPLVDDCLILEGDYYTNGDIKVSRPKFIRNYLSSENPNIISCLLSGSIASKSQCDLFIHDLNVNNYGVK